MTKDEEIKKYGRPLPELERLIITTEDLLALELQFAEDAVAEPDAMKMCQLLECARFVTEFRKQPVH